MKKNTVLASLAMLAFIAFMVIACNGNGNSPGDGHNAQENVITPIDFPDRSVTGVNFPEFPSQVSAWVMNSDTSAMAEHAWGIWAGLTHETGQVYAGDKLLVFETWMGTSELQTMMINDDVTIKKTHRTPLEYPSQFGHGGGKSFSVVSGGQQTDTSSLHSLLVTVSFSPSSAKYALDNEIFNTEVLEQYQNLDVSTFGSIPPFPRTAINIKPTYLVVHNNGTDLIEVPVWPGQPEPAADIPNFDTFWQYVFVDPTNSVNEADPIVPSLEKYPSGNVPENAKVNLKDFIHFKIDGKMATYINEQQGSVQGANAKAGDLALLVGMHVATKEIPNWLWQTFFWAPNPGNPPFPSSGVYAGSIGAGTHLSPAASHYAAVPIYSMVLPGQGIYKGTNDTVKPFIGYNPYLEPGLGKIAAIPNKLDTNFMWGVQSNCMSCHALASYKRSSGNLFRYTADQYIPMDADYFNGYVQTDFAWSIIASKFNKDTGQP